MTLNNTVRLSLRRPRNSRILFTIIPIVLLMVSCFILPILPDAKTPPILSNQDFEVDTILAESVPSEPIWTYVYDGSPDSDNNFQSVIQSRSGDLIAVGNQMSTGSEDSDWFTVLTDSQGGGADDGQVWTDYYGGSDSDSAFSLVQAINNDDIIMTGYTTNSDTDFSLRRLHPDGTENWTVTFNEAYDQVAFDIAACSNGDLVVVGSTIEGPLWPSDMQLFRIFPNGTEAWNRTYGGSQWEAAKSVIECSNGDLVLVGYSTDIAGTGEDLWVLRVDGTNGDVIWDQIIGGDFDDYGDEVIECADGGFAIVGSTKSFGHSEGDMWLIRLDSIGDVVWEQGYGGTEPDWGRSLVEIPAGGFALIGSTESYGSGNSDVWLVRTDNFGNVLWSQTYGGEGADTGNAIVIEQVGGLIIAGGSKSWGGNDEDAFLLKVADPPMWLQVPSDVTIEYGELYSVQLEVTATYIDSWWLNDTEYFNIDGNGLVFCPEVLPYGNYDVQVWVNDTLGNAITTTFTVTVSYSPLSDTLDPLWERTYGGSSDHTSQEIVSCESGGFAIAGTRGLDYASSSSTTTSWHHDCSNTTGFDQYPSWPLLLDPTYGVDWEGDMNSDGSRFSFSNYLDPGSHTGDWHGPIFAHSYNDPFKLADFKNLTVHLEANNAVIDHMGFVTVYLCDANFMRILEVRLVDYTAFGNSGYNGVYYYAENGSRIGMVETLGEWFSFDGSLSIWVDEEAGLKGSLPSLTEGPICPLSNIEIDREIKYLVIRHFVYQDYNQMPMYVHDINVEYSKEVLNPSPTSPTTEDAWLARLDSYGNLMWNRTYGNGANSTITSLIECGNGDFLMAGSSWNATTKSDFWLLRVDSEGNPLWNKTYGGNGNDEVASVIETSDGGFAATGYKYNLTRPGEDGTPGSYDMWLIKTDSTGLMLWNSTEYYELGSVVWNYDQKANCVIECSDGDLLVAGTVCYYDAFEIGVHNLNGFLYRTSADGVFELADQYGLAHGEQFNSVEECANGDFIVIGSSNRYDPADVLVCRFESSLSVEFPWYKIYQADGENWGVSIRETNNGFVMLSNTWAGSLGNQDTRLMRINSEGAHFWQHEYGGSQLDEGSSIIPLAEGGYAVTGFSKNNSLGISNAWFFIVQPVQWTDISQNQVIEFGEAFNYRLGCESVSGIVAPHGGELFNGNEYRLITPGKYWTDARDACSSQGGHLVSITSPEENNFIWSLLPAGSTWIGLTDNIIEGSWYWVGTSDPTIYFNWEPGEPNAFTSGEDYCVVHESTGKWNDAPNNYVLPYVCEWETQYIKFDWELNDLTNFSIAVDTSTAMADITNITQLQVGEYSFNIFVNNSFGDFLNKTITLTVEPHKAPEWIATPTNQLVEFGEHFEYDLEATDTAGIDTWVVNNTIDFMIDGNGMITSITALPVAEYPLEITVTDILGNSTIAEFIITVVDTTAPEFIVTPEDQHLQYEEYFLYSIGATDLSGIDSWWLNDTTYVNVTSGILSQLHTIPCGIFPLDLFVNDTQGNIRSTSFTLTVSIDPPFWIVGPKDQIAEFTHEFEYSIIAYAPGGFGEWWVNDSANFDIDEVGVVTNATFLEIGTYGLFVTATDVWGQTISTEFSVVIQDTIGPTWTDVPDEIHLECDSTLNVDLEASDPSGVSHWSLNDTEHFTVTKTGRLAIAAGIDPGMYGLAVTAYDSYYNTRTCIITIYVSESSAPTWLEEPADQTSEFGSEFIYQLHAEDITAIETWWLADTTCFLIDETGRITNATCLQVGDYSLTAWVSDTLGNARSSSIIIHVIDSTAPVWVNPPINQGLEYRESLEMQVTAWDLSGIGLWTVNDTAKFAISDTGLVTNAVLLDVGTYYLQVGVYDIYGNLRNSTIVIVVRTLSPEALSTPMTFVIAVAFTGGVVFLLFTIVYVIRRPRVTNVTTVLSMKKRSGR